MQAKSGMRWDAKGGEIYVHKIPSMRITDIAKAIKSDAHQEIIGIRREKEFMK